MSCPFPVRRRSRVVGEQLPPAVGEDVDRPVELGPLAALRPAAGDVVELREGQDAEIGEAIDAWFDSAIGDIERGLDAAGRFPPSSRRVRATLAFGQLEFASRRWMRHGWDVDRDETHALLTEAWLHLLADPGTRDRSLTGALGPP
jgi:hypothetical protein